MQVFSYDIKEYNFKKIVEEYLEIDDIQELKKVQSPLLNSKSIDQTQNFHRKFYDNMDLDSNKKFINLYNDFIKTVFPEKNFIYQTFPVIRIHLLENLSVFDFHKDK